jgi:hypothetical protein
MHPKRGLSCLVLAATLLVTTDALAATGTWTRSTNRTSNKSVREHAACYDPVRKRMIVFGGYDQIQYPSPYYTNEVWTLGLPPASETWSQMAILSPLPGCLAPSPRARASIFYDPKYDQLFVFGGASPNWNGWLFSLELGLTPPNYPRWCNVSIQGTSPSLSTFNSDTKAVFDVGRRRVVAVSPYQGVFEFSLDSLVWHQISTQPIGGILGDPRLIGGRGYSLVYDSNADQILVFGGYHDVSPDNCVIEYGHSTVYAMPMAPTNGYQAEPTWQAVATGAPNVVDGGVVFDAAANRVLVYGGEKCFFSGGLTLSPQIWALSLDAGTYTWQTVSTTGNAPPNRYMHSAILSATRDLFVFGGTSNQGQINNFSDTYYFRPTDPTPPEPRARHISVYDPDRQRMLVWGGDDRYRLFDQDIWAMDLRPGFAPTWSKLIVTAGPVANQGIRGAAAVFDTRSHKVYVQGGSKDLSNDAAAITNTMAQLTFTDDTHAAWSLLTPSGTPPPPRMFHSMSYNAACDTMVVFGGWNGMTSLNDTYLMTTDAQGNKAWSQVVTQQAPEPRYGHAAFYDSNRHRLTIMGGVGNQYDSWIGPVWGLAAATPGTSPQWATISGGGGPADLRFAAPAFQPSTDRAVITGGSFYRENMYTNQLTWIYYLFQDPQWQSGWGSYDLTYNPKIPNNHVFQHTAVYDPIGIRLIRFGGAGVDPGYPPSPFFTIDDTKQANVNNLVWQLTMPSYIYDCTWSQVAPYGTPVGGSGQGGGGNPHAAEFHGGVDENPGGISVSGGLRSPSIQFRLMQGSGSFRVELFSIQGRRIRSLRSQGDAVFWDRRDQTGRTVPSGVYLYRVIGGSISKTGKIVLAR